MSIHRPPPTRIHLDNVEHDATNDRYLSGQSVLIYKNGVSTYVPRGGGRRVAPAPAPSVTEEARGGALSRRLEQVGKRAVREGAPAKTGE